MTTLTDWELSTLRCAAAAGNSFNGTCREINRVPKTVREMLKRMGLYEEFRSRFAQGRNNVDGRSDGSIQVLSLDEFRQRPLLLPKNPQARWLVKSWRAA